MGISGTSGVLKERGTSGMVLRTTSTAAQTSVKAISVPMLVISPASRAGTKSCQQAHKYHEEQVAACRSTELFVDMREERRQQPVVAHA